MNVIHMLFNRFKNSGAKKGGEVLIPVPQNDGWGTKLPESVRVRRFAPAQDSIFIMCRSSELLVCLHLAYGAAAYGDQALPPYITLVHTLVANPPMTPAATQKPHLFA